MQESRGDVALRSTWVERRNDRISLMSRGDRAGDYSPKPSIKRRQAIVMAGKRMTNVDGTSIICNEGHK